MAENYPHQTRNFFAFGSDAFFFSLAYTGFVNPAVVLPAFMARIGGSAESIGLVLSLISLGWCLPQIVGGNFISRIRRKKPFAVRIALAGRMAIPLFAFLLAWTGGEPAFLVLGALCLAFILFLGTDGFATIAWMDMLGHALPPQKRGSYISIWQAVSSIAILGIAQLVAFILGSDGPQFPQNYEMLFGFASILFMFSALGTLSIFEPHPAQDAPQPPHIPWRDLGGHILHLLRSDERLRRLVTARVIFSFAMMAFPFFVLFATEKLQLPGEALGTFITAQTIGTMVGGLALGRVADRYGPQRAVQIGAVLVTTAPILGLVLAARTWWLISSVTLIYIWIYICSGLANNLLFLGFGNYLLDIAPAEQRTIYLGTMNAINSLGVIASFVAGWLLDLTSYSVLFGVTLAFCLTALILAIRLPKARGIGI